MAKINKGKVEFETEAKFGYLKGSSKWAKILEADDYGNFSISVYPDEETLKHFEDEMKELQAAAVAELDDVGKKYMEADVIKEDDDGNKFVSFKLKEEGWEGKKNSIQIYDVYGNQVPDWDKLIGNGSVVKVKYRAAPYYMASSKMCGVSYRFYAVQVIKLEEYTQGDSGFGDETDGDEDQPF